MSNFSNSGTITVRGNAVFQSVGARFTNSGTITASGIAATVQNTAFANTGTIMSTGSTGAQLGAGTNYQMTNSGVIRGACIGVDLGASLTNTGTISSAGTGVVLEGYGTLVNAAGGVVTGSTRAVTASSFSSTLVNAGTINGDVVFNGGSNGTFNANRYIAQTGGVLNGNLTLGSSDLLVTDLVNTGRGQFAGINGSVTAASGAQLRYRVASDAAATLGPAGPFAIAGYELSNNARLTLTAPSTIAQQLLLAGVGTVDVTANLSATTAPAILSTSVVAVPGLTTPATALSVISRGTITITRANGASPATGGAVSLGANDSFTNAGTINVVDRNSFSYTYAVTGGASVTNSGAIRLDGGYGVSGATTLTNTGTITQVTGGALAQGVVNVTTVNNSGTISVGGAAVQLSSYGAQSVLTNSGLVASTGGAVVTGPYAYNGAVNNLAGGIIRGGAGTAVQMNGGSFTNAGTVTGTVDLGFASSGRSYNNAAYVAAGGTVAGNLLFGNGDDLFLQTGATTGVSGVIDGGGGRNTYGRVFTATGSFALDAVPVRNFADRLIEALGADTVATATSGSAFTGNLYATGTGSIVNAATINGQLLLSVPYSAQAVIPAAQNALLSLTNTGNVSGGVFGSVASFTNTGGIGAARQLAPAVSIANTGVLSFVNSGQITANATTPGAIDSAVELGGVDSVSVTNSGAILGIGGVAVSATFAGAATGNATVLNSGSVIGTAGLPALYASAVASAGGGGGTVTISNSGTLSGVGGASAFGTVVQLDGTAQLIGFSINNTGTLSARGGTGRGANVIALQVGGTGGVTGQVVNASGGTVSATGGYARAVLASGVALDLTNAGAITATGNTAAIAVQSLGNFNNVVRNSGTITGDILLAGGADRVENAGFITGNVLLGAGDDMFVQRGGTVSGVVDGGDGADLLQVDASGGGAVAGAGFTNFERVQQIGTGNVTYSGAFGVGTIELASGGLIVAAGTQLSTTGATTITGTGAGVSITNAGTIAGGITLGDGGNSVTNSGTIGGPVLLGAGNDSFRTTSGATLGGVVDGGTGYNTLTLALASDTMLRPGVFRNFEALATEGASTLVLAGGAFSYDRVTAQGNLAIASDASLAANVTFGAGDNRFSIAGGFAGSVDGGAGNDTVEVSGGTQAAPVAFGAIGNVEAYRQTARFATLSGAGSVGAMYLGGGRFVGLAGSVLTASQIGVDTGATFGSAGVVNGNVTVAGTLSPGASPGTMTVNGNVSLLGGSVSLFELTPAVSDKLVVNGSVGIAPGATLQLAPTGAVGGALDLVTATGGVSGAFTSLVKPASLSGFLSYQPTRIQFVTAFTGDATFTPQAARALSYTNAVLASGQASAALLAALPRLLTANGASSAAGFNRITPEAYATAQQIGVESGLALADSARGTGFAAPRERTGLFTFGELQGDWTRLPGNGATGASRAEASAQGLLGGVGVGTGAFSFGAFAGYRWTNQRIAALGARTRHDGTVAGVQARVAAGAFAFVATGAYDGGDAVTTRAVPDGVARARYGLHGWTGDVNASYGLELGANWRLSPHVGGTVIHDIRERVTETGGSGFALTVARGRERASFVDGGIGVEGGTATGARFHPFVSLGARWQLQGREPLALAGFGGGATTLLAYGARRAEVVGTGTLGFAADVARGLTLFTSATGEAAGGEHRVAARAGLRARF